MEAGKRLLQEARRNTELEQAGMRLLLVVSGVLYTVFLALIGRLDGGFYHPVIALGCLLCCFLANDYFSDVFISAWYSVEAYCIHGI